MQKKLEPADFGYPTPQNFGKAIADAFAIRMAGHLNELANLIECGKIADRGSVEILRIVAESLVEVEGRS